MKLLFTASICFEYEINLPEVWKLVVLLPCMAMLLSLRTAITSLVCCAFMRLWFLFSVFQNSYLQLYRFIYDICAYIRHTVLWFFRKLLICIPFERFFERVVIFSKCTVISNEGRFFYNFTSRPTDLYLDFNDWRRSILFSAWLLRLFSFVFRHEMTKIIVISREKTIISGALGAKYRNKIFLLAISAFILSLFLLFVTKQTKAKKRYLSLFHYFSKRRRLSLFRHEITTRLKETNQQS